jgi:glycosyltransferase involved in cell wall biosynthesis
MEGLGIRDRSTLVIAGEGPMREHLERQAEGLNITFVGKVPYKEIQAYLQASDIFVLPSVYEPSAVALLDCIATGTPVIATHIGGTPEIIKNRKTGVLIKEKSSEDIADAIDTLLTDKKLYNDIKRNQKKILKKYLWTSMAKKYIAAYNQVLNE